MKFKFEIKDLVKLPNILCYIRIIMVPLFLYLYFTADNVLYCWNRINQVEVFYTFSSKITDIERYANGSDREEIAVGLENGEFYIIDASYESISGQKEKVLFKTEGLGRVVDVQYKYGNSSNFNKESRL
mgnify:CR=1 FL=1